MIMEISAYIYAIQKNKPIFLLSNEDLSLNLQKYNNFY